MRLIARRCGQQACGLDLCAIPGMRTAQGRQLPADKGSVFKDAGLKWDKVQFEILVRPRSQGEFWGQRQARRCKPGAHRPSVAPLRSLEVGWRTSAVA